MKVAVLGPVGKDYIKIDKHLELQLGGCSYYITNTLKNLGAEVTPFIAFDKKHKDWVESNFQDIEIEHINVKGTLEFHAEYSSDDPNTRTAKAKHSPIVIKPTKNLLAKLERFDYIIITSLFYDNTPRELFLKLKHKNLVSGKFGMFSYPKNGELIWKHPENLVEVLPYLKYLFLDINEAKFISNKNDLKEMGKFFIDNGLENMIITDGSRGSHLFIKNSYYKIPAFSPKKLVDPTGAGDTYLASYIRALELFDNPEERGRFAAMTSTISLEKRGAFDSSLKDVLDRLKTKN